MKNLNFANRELPPDPDQLLNILREEGSIYLPGLIPCSLRQELSQLANTIDTNHLDQTEAAIAQEFETISFLYPEQTPRAINRLREILQDLVGSTLPQWQPNEVTLQRYFPGQVGIDWHRDYARDLWLVAVFTVEGEARFDIEVYDHPNLTHLESHTTQPGDLVLIRGMGLSQVDDRPYHRILSPRTGVRTSIAFRHNTRIGE